MNGEAEAGSRLGSLYVLDQRIGSGGMGTVWSAHHVDTGEPVAVKILSENLAQDPDLVGRFLRERTALMNVHHPNLVEIRDLVVENRRVALVMDLVQGYDAARLLEQNGSMPLRETARLGSEIAQALSAVHGAGIIHRDLKPANILVESATGRSRLVDFGIAWIAGNPRLTAVNSVVGTPHYLAPELLTGGQISPAADVYALAICLYQLLSGVVPFDGEHYAQILQKHLNEAPQPHPAIPPTLWTIIEAMLAKNPQARPDLNYVAGQLAVFGGGQAPAPLQLPAGPSTPVPSPQLPAQAGPGTPVPYQAPGTPIPGGAPQAGYPVQGTPVPGQGTPVPSAPTTPVPGDPSTPVPGSGGYTANPSMIMALPPSAAYGGYDTPSQKPDPWSGPTNFTPNPPPFQPMVVPERGNRGKVALIVALVVVLCGVGVGAWALSGGSGGGKPVAGPSASASVQASASPARTLPPYSIHHWPLCCSQLQDTSDDTTATNDGVVLNAAGKGDDAVFNGKSGTQILVNGPVVDTENSFTFAFAVTMSGKSATSTGREAMVEQRGSQGCAACVEFDPFDDRIVFEMQSSDTASAHITKVDALDAPVQGTSYRVIASFNAGTDQMSLYIGGALQGTVKFTPTWKPTGPLSLGSGLEGGAPSDWFAGSMSDLWLWNRSMTPAQVTQATK
jgi:serine/threonine-protein kinase